MSARLLCRRGPGAAPSRAMVGSALALALAGCVALAEGGVDRIVLQDGTVVEGKLMGFADGLYIIETEQGTQRIALAQIARIIEGAAAQNRPAPAATPAPTPAPAPAPAPATMSADKADAAARRSARRAGARGSGGETADGLREPGSWGGAVNVGLPQISVDAVYAPTSTRWNEVGLRAGAALGPGFSYLGQGVVYTGVFASLRASRVVRFEGVAGPAAVWVSGSPELHWAGGLYTVFATDGRTTVRLGGLGTVAVAGSASSLSGIGWFPDISLGIGF
jgi:hypothetical protein